MADGRPHLWGGLRLLGCLRLRGRDIDLGYPNTSYTRCQESESQVPERLSPVGVAVRFSVEPALDGSA